MERQKSSVKWMLTALAVVLAPCLLAQNSVPRPAIVGVAHIALKTNDLDAARNFYGRDLGFQEPFAADRPAGAACFKVNDRQYIEVSAELKSEAEDRLSPIAFETADVKQLRDYLDSKGVKVPGSVTPGPDGDLSMMIQDPEGHRVEFVQYLPGSQ